jgi:hypothetical protein
MKKLLVLCGLLNVILGSLAAQTFNPADYEDETLAGFTAWRESYAGEQEPRKFKISVLYGSGDDSSILFRDPGLEGEITFDIENPWSGMTSGQKVVIYITAQGPWVWDRRLDAVDYGNGRLVQAGGAEALAQDRAGETAPSERSPSQRPRVPVTSPSPDEIGSSQESPQEEDAGFDYGRAPRVESPQQVVVRISGKTPVHGRRYRLQVGSYSVRGNASRAVDSLKKTGLNPILEQHENYLRVVLPRIPGEEVVETARKIGYAGFSDVWCREEP